MSRKQAVPITDQDRLTAATTCLAYRTKWGLSQTRMACVLAFSAGRESLADQYVSLVERANKRAPSETVTAALRLRPDRSPQDYHYAYLVKVHGHQREPCTSPDEVKKIMALPFEQRLELIRGWGNK